MSREDFSDLGAGVLAEGQQIRSPESAANQGPRALPGDKQGSLTTGSPSPSCLILTLTVAVEAPRGDPLLGPAEIQRQSQAPLLGPLGLAQRWEEGRPQNLPERAWHDQPWKPNSLPWKLEV